jgi:LPXTG-site transpeptidase (sortase) family protein
LKKLAFLAVLILLLAMPSFTAFASEGDGDRGLAITVVVPIHEETPEPTPATSANIPNLFPVSVSETREPGRREIIRVYELRDYENPDHIPREPFEREGFRFELAEITRSEMLSFDSREHVETITVSTSSNDLETILRLLATTLEYQSDDGFIGLLTLDVSTITVESAGTRTTSSNVSRTREFPHLSNPDTSLVPRTITEGGRTYNLANVEWRAGNMEAINYTQIPQSYTAVATYTATVSRTSTIGYNTTAEYRGVISRTSQGRMRFTANFIGIPIVMPTVTQPTPNPAPSEDAPITDDCPIITENGNGNGQLYPVYPNGTENGAYTDTTITDDPQDQETLNGEQDEEQAESQAGGISPILLLILLPLVGVIAFFAGKYGKKFFVKTAKPLCLGLVAVMLLGAPQTAFASSQIPRYGFGGGNTDAVHIDTSVTTTPTRYSHIAHGEGLTANQVQTFHDGEFIGRLTVERLNRTISVFEGESLASMEKGGGRFSFSGINHGNTAIIGHNRGRAGYFSFVRNLREGDTITLEMGGVTRSYEVTHLYTISYTDFSPMMQFGDNRLTLITCLEYQRNMRRVAVAIEI